MGKQKPDLPQGTLDMLILKALSLGPMHGYGVGQRIRQLAEELLKIEKGTSIPRSIAMSRKDGLNQNGASQRTVGARDTTN